VDSPDSDLIDALQAAHDAEFTASEKWHKQEHAFKDGTTAYPKLKKWFHKRHREAVCRQHDCRKTLMELGATVDTNLGDTSYADNAPDAFEQACDTIDGLRAAHQAVFEAANAARKNASDPADRASYRAINEKFHGYARDLDKLYLEGDRKQQLIKDMGLPLFLSKMTKGK